MKTNNKLREALTRVKKIAASYINCHDDEIDRVMTEIVATCDSALAEPVKNCEVGTAMEQCERFKDLCRKYRRGPGPRANCKGCPIQHESLHVGCTFAWAQMPYVEKEGGDK